MGRRGMARFFVGHKGLGDVHSKHYLVGGPRLKARYNALLKIDFWFLNPVPLIEAESPSQIEDQRNPIEYTSGAI